MIRLIKYTKQANKKTKTLLFAQFFTISQAFRRRHRFEKLFHYMLLSLVREGRVLLAMGKNFFFNEHKKFQFHNQTFLMSFSKPH